MKNKFAKVFAIVKQINDAGGNTTHKELLKDFTAKREGGATESLSDLKFYELQEFERSLSSTLSKQKPKDYDNDPLNQTRRAIIAQFKSIGRDTKEAISWAEKYGVNGQKKRFNNYTGQELFILLKNAEKVKSDFIISTNKKLTNELQSKK
jgi:DNA modification methylase